MKITRIKVSNHVRVADVEMEVRDHLVLVGPNAIGKSTILRLLDCALGASWTQLASSLDTGQLCDPAKPLVVEVQLDELDSDDVAHFTEKLEVGPRTDPDRRWLTVRLTATVSPIDPERLTIERSFVKPLVEDQAVTRDDLQRLGWAYLPASRSPERDLGGGRTSAIKALLAQIDLSDAGTTSIDAALLQLSQALEHTPELERLRTDLAAELTLLLPEPMTKDDIAVDLPSSTSSEPLNDVDVQLIRNGQRSPLSAQSDGLRSLAVVAVQLVARRSARILAIDEPEIHLHPRGQANLARLLSSAPGQRVVATHAPAVLSRFAPRDVVAVTSRGVRQLAPTVFADDPRRFHHWWNDPALEPLTAERIVLVEGISDRILIEAAARSLGHDLDRAGVSVVALNTAYNFGAAISLFGPSGFGIRILGLVDESEAGEPAAALEVDVADLKDHGIFTCHADLEAEYVAALTASGTISLLLASGLFSAMSITTACGNTDIDAVSESELTAFVRHKRRKVEAATALAAGMTPSHAAALTTLKDLVERAVAP